MELPVEKNTVSIVIPVYNEEGNIRKLIDLIREVRFPDNYTLLEVLLIDDGSTDRSVEYAEEISREFTLLKILVFERNYGQTSALSAGFHKAKGDIVVCLDGDCQNNPGDIPRLLEKVDEGYDCVSGWRKDRQDEWLRTALSHVANGIISKSTGVHLHDYGCTLKAYRRKHLNKIHLYGEMHRFIPIYLNTVGAKICELPVAHREREWGQSKYGLNRTFKVLLDLAVIRFLNKYSSRPIYLFGTAGFISIGIAILTAFYSVYLKIFENISFIQTPMPFMSMFSIFMGFIFIFMGLLAELLMRVYFESQSKPTYHIKHIINNG